MFSVEHASSEGPDVMKERGGGGGGGGNTCLVAIPAVEFPQVLASSILVNFWAKANFEFLASLLE